MVGEVLLGAAEAVDEEQTGRRPGSPAATVARPTPSSVVTTRASSVELYGHRANEPVNEPVT